MFFNGETVSSVGRAAPFGAGRRFESYTVSFCFYQITDKGVGEMNARLFVKRNASTILTGLASIGVVTTAVMAVKATPKALKLIEEAEQEKGEKLTKWETVKTAGSSYIPSAIVGVATITCLLASNILNKRTQASLMSAYALLDQSYKEYKNKLIELYGEEQHNEIIDAIAIEKAEEIGVRGSYLGTSCDLSLEENDSEPRTFYDEHSGRYFTATIEQVMNAEYHLNRNYILRGYSYLNEFYEFLGIEETEYGSVLGWAPNDDGMYWIDFNHRKVTLDDGMEIYIIEMPFEPTYDFLEHY